jgi:hypothetical protein
LGTAAVIVAVVGCGTVSEPSSHQPPAGPDWKAIATVVGEAYRTEGQARPVVFVDTGEVCDSVAPSCIPPDGDIDPELKSVLETELRVKVRPPSAACLTEPSVPALTPVLCETGEVGVTVSLGRFTEDDQGRLHVDVSVARSGLDGAFVEYVLEPAEDGWTVSEVNYDQAVP